MRYELIAIKRQIERSRKILSADVNPNLKLKMNEIEMLVRTLNWFGFSIVFVFQ